IKWVVEVKQCDVTAVVINHFHDDCLGGLDVFHELGTPSFANSTTIALAAQEGVTAPQIGFEQLMELEVGNEKIVNRYFGEAHTQDNIVSYIPSEELLFGGCMIKSLNAKKGNLADANEKDWSATVSKIKAAYPKLKTVVPGHGAHNGTILLDYTIGLFTPDK
ncbi:MAG: MBL fold metallo-hydrolase, partial [Bacteroidota bacterium]